VATGAAIVLLVAGALTGCIYDFDGTEPEASPAPPAAVTIDPGAVVEGEDRFGESPAPEGEEPEEPAADEPAESPEPDATSPQPVDCTGIQAAWNATNQALLHLSADHPRALVNSFRTAAESMGSIEEVPEAVAAPWTAMSDYLAQVNAGFESVDADDATAVAAAMAAAVTAADTRAATAAGEKITAFVSAGCPA